MWIADAHVHCFAGEAAENPVQWAVRHREPHWERLVTAGPQGWADEQRLVDQMDRDGVDFALIAGWYWQNADTARMENERISAICQRHPSRLAWLAALVPDDKGAYLEEARQLRRQGAWGFGELLPQVQDFRLDDPHWLEFSAWAQADGIPLLMHVTEPVGHDYPGRIDTPFMPIVTWLESFPTLPVILAHWGGGLPFYRHNRRVDRAMKSVWIDTAASPLLYRPSIWESMNAQFPADRILFGSDFPLRVFPSRTGQPNFRDLLAECRSRPISQRDQRMLLGGNFADLFKFPLPGHSGPL